MAKRRDRFMLRHEIARQLERGFFFLERLWRLAAHDLLDRDLDPEIVQPRVVRLQRAFAQRQCFQTVGDVRLRAVGHGVAAGDERVRH